jgi:hypothetical protein
MKIEVHGMNITTFAGDPRDRRYPLVEVGPLSPHR